MKVKAAILFVLVSCFLFNSDAEQPAQCLQPHPRGYGPCDMLISGFYYNPDHNECEQWMEDGCGAEGGNSYDIIEDCVNDCIVVN